LEIGLFESTSNRIESGAALTVMLGSGKPRFSWEVGEIIELMRVVFPLSTWRWHFGYFGTITGIKADLPPPITPNVRTLFTSSIVPVVHIDRVAVS